MNFCKIESTQLAQTRKKISLTPKYEVRLANESELEQVFKLRYDIFYKEMGANDCASDLAGTDIDKYDKICDHLIVTKTIQKSAEDLSFFADRSESYESQIIGTYRMLPASRAQSHGLDLYSSSEFDLTAIQAKFGGDLLELGRSCVHPSYRTGVVPRLLWAGIAEYAFSKNIKAILGCVSVGQISDVQAVRLSTALQVRNLWHTSMTSKVQDPYEIKSVDREDCNRLAAMLPNNALELVPPLMKGYFNLGAKICGGPAWDKQFRVHDYLILLECENITQKYYNSLIKPLALKASTKTQ